jgi:hypothetical protein
VAEEIHQNKHSRIRQHFLSPAAVRDLLRNPADQTSSHERPDHARAVKIEDLAGGGSKDDGPIEPGARQPAFKPSCNRRLGQQRWNKIENAAFGVLRRDVPFSRGGIPV